MSKEEERRGVPISPKSMIDPVAEWPLRRVVDHLRKKEQDDRPPTSRLSCRSSIKSLVTVVDDLAAHYGVARNRISGWMSYHGVSFAREDIVIGQLVAIRAKIRRASLLVDDTDSVDLMNSLLPYSPRYQDSEFVHLVVYDWVASEFEELARACGVHKYQIAQIFIAKSALTDDTARMAATASRLMAEVTRWDMWMSFRLGALERLVKDIV